MRSFKTGKNTIYYRVSGSGNPVIFLHGFLEDHSMWDNIVPEIVSQGCKVYVIDLPCHGKSRFQGEKCTMAEMAQIIFEFCKNQKLINPHVFGHSMGGYVGLELLKLFPLRLTLIHSNFWKDPDEKKNDRNRVIEIVQKNKLRLIQEAIPNLFSNQNRETCEKAIEGLIQKAALIPSSEICASTAGMRDRLDNSALLNQNKITIIHGENDNIVKTEILEKEMQKLATLPKVFTIKNCGHMSIWESPHVLINYLKVIVFQ